eukprot:4668632-Amphidinium_carterae.1
MNTVPFPMAEQTNTEADKIHACGDEYMPQEQQVHTSSSCPSADEDGEGERMSFDTPRVKRYRRLRDKHTSRTMREPPSSVEDAMSGGRKSNLPDP